MRCSPAFHSVHTPPAHARARVRVCSAHGTSTPGLVLDRFHVLVISDVSLCFPLIVASIHRLLLGSRRAAFLTLRLKVLVAKDECGVLLWRSRMYARLPASRCIYPGVFSHPAAVALRCLLSHPVYFPPAQQALCPLDPLPPLASSHL